MAEIFRESSSAEIQALEESLAPFTRDADAPADLTGQPARIRIHTYVLAIAAVVCIVLGALGDYWPVLAWALGVPLALLALGSFASDMSFPSARRRRRSAEAVRCYFKAVKHGRWDLAHACLSQRARSAIVTVPEIDKLGSRPLESKMATPHGVKRYWNTLTRTSGSHTRWMRKLDIQKMSGSDHVHRYRVRLEIYAYHQMHLLLLLLGLIPGALIIHLFLTKVFRTEFEVFAFRHESQWWLVSGELGLLQQVAELPKARVVKR